MALESRSISSNVSGIAIGCHVSGNLLNMDMKKQLMRVKENIIIYD